MRGFEILSSFLHRDVSLPVRKTAYSAGYDLAAIEKTIIPAGQMRIIPTGLKAYMQPDEYLGIHLRSSLAMKNHLMLANSEGIIDSDYYNNPENEGHILIGILNRGQEPFCVEAGMRIAQAIFCKYLTADYEDTSSFKTRQGGFGSTGI